VAYVDESRQLVTVVLADGVISHASPAYTS
jgi:hypothetical protein